MGSIVLSKLLRQGRNLDPKLRLVGVLCPSCQSQDIRLQQYIIAVRSEEGNEKQVASLLCSKCGRLWEDSPENLVVSFDQPPPLISDVKTRGGIRDGGISIELRTNQFLGTKVMAQKVLHTLINAGGVFVPESIDGSKGRIPFDSSDLTIPVKGWTEGWVAGEEKYSLGIGTQRLKPLKVLFHVSITDFVMFDSLRLYFCLDKKGVLDFERVKLFDRYVGLDKLIAIAKSFYDVTGANWGKMRNDFHEHSLGTHFDDEGNVRGWSPPKVKNALPGLFWANFFGPEYVEMWGRDRLLSAPCYKVEELRDGGMMILLSKSPFDASKPDYGDMKQKLYDYLGDDPFTGKVLPIFRIEEGRKRRDARPLKETGGSRDDLFH